jgi:two-component sensor histidine kinase
MSASSSERDLQHQTLFDTMLEGFALCEAIWDPSGKLSDYVILEMNPALQGMLGVGPEAVGTLLSDSGSDQSRWLTLCEGVLKSGKPVGFEFHNRNTGRWHEIRLTRVTPDSLAQFFFDITERKAALEHQAALFNELNHRVRNNLTMVSGLLRMQARDAEPGVRAQLMKAIDRVQTISDVHGSLYQGGRREDIEFGAYLERLCERLGASVVDEDRVEIAVETQPASVPLDQAVPLGIVVNELITNAAKYAYPAPKRGVIRVRFGPASRGLALSVADDGEGLQAPAIDAAGGGLGMKLVRALVQQVGGELNIVGPPGARFEISFPRVMTRSDTSASGGE